jgi:hypothetical protein
MSTADIIITAVAAMFIACVIPALRSHEKPPIATSLPLFLGLFTIASVYVSLGLALSAAMTFAQGFLWGWLALQKSRQNERNHYIGMDGRRHDRLVQ